MKKGSFFSLAVLAMLSTQSHADDSFWGSITGPDSYVTGVMPFGGIIYGGNSIIFNANDYANGTAIGNNILIRSGNTAIGNNIFLSGNNSSAIGNYSSSTRDNVLSVGGAGSERQIVNVADGQLETDAINVRQLNNGIESANIYTDFSTNSLRNELRNEMNINTAIAIAMETPVIENGKNQAVSVNVGHYKTASALGVSYARRVNNDSFVNVGASVAGGNVALKSGLNFSF